MFVFLDFEHLLRLICSFVIMIAEKKKKRKGDFYA